MADPPPTFEGMITRCGPVLESIMQHLTRWDFRNLQLAGVRISVSREFQRRHHLPNRCDEVALATLANPKTYCDNTSETFDIRPCMGSPMKVTKNGVLLLEQRLGSTRIQCCLRDEEWRWYLLQPNPDPEPNIDRFPIHTKICLPCRDASAAELLEEQSQVIARFNATLCKVHSLDHMTAQFPVNSCRCLAFVRDPWRCRRCYEDTLMYLGVRTEHPPPICQHIPDWQRPWVYLKSLWDSCHSGPTCPIEGCFRPAWLDPTGARMQMCMSCYAITKI
ncbi:hypothetical protein MMC07_006122 [Pseudocyphellaria aurata]|nr:hypothetical protein [Pseudocyphellaria aurata]